MCTALHPGEKSLRRSLGCMAVVASDPTVRAMSRFSAVWDALLSDSKPLAPLGTRVGEPRSPALTDWIHSSLPWLRAGKKENFSVAGKC